jgi:hypothetical protein
MAWRGPHNGPDPLLWKRRWRTGVRAYWVAEGKRAGYLRCARCNRLIDFLGSRYIEGTRKLNPLALCIGHVHDRASMKRLGYRDDQINDLGNSQPECARCSWTSGAKQGNAMQRQRVASTPTREQVPSTKIDSAPSVLPGQTFVSRW